MRQGRAHEAHLQGTEHVLRFMKRVLGAPADVGHQALQLRPEIRSSFLFQGLTCRAVEVERSEPCSPRSGDPGLSIAPRALWREYRPQMSYETGASKPHSVCRMKWLWWLCRGSCVLLGHRLKCFAPFPIREHLRIHECLSHSMQRGSTDYMLH